VGEMTVLVMLETGLLVASGAGLLLIFARSILRKLAQPAKSWLHCLLDAVLEVPFRLRLGRFGQGNDVKSALVAAMSTTKLKALSLRIDKKGRGGGEEDASFVTRYAKTRESGLRALGVEYSPLGYLVVQRVMTRRMETRLRFVDFIRRHPQVEQTSLGSSDPIFVIGFPRTGTTFLHELLGLHPRLRMHYTWEQIDPVPRISMPASCTKGRVAEVMREDRRQRYAENRSMFAMMLRILGDDIQSIHRIGYDDPEECTTPCALELPWAISELPLHIAAPQLLSEGAGNTFAYYRRFLQLLTWQHLNCVATDDEREREEGKTWMLKCPFHLPYLDEMTEEFPGCTVVWTHRDPVECIASACSLYEVLARAAIETNSLDRAVLGRAVLDYTEEALLRAHATLDKIAETHPHVKVIHVRYTDNVQDPVKVCRSILRGSGFGGKGDDEWEHRVCEYLAKNKAERTEKAQSRAKKLSGGGNTIHTYSLQDYGLSATDVRMRFKKYTDRHNLVVGEKEKVDKKEI